MILFSPPKKPDDISSKNSKDEFVALPQARKRFLQEEEKEEERHATSSKPKLFKHALATGGELVYVTILDIKDLDSSRTFNKPY